MLEPRLKTLGLLEYGMLKCTGAVFKKHLKKEGFLFVCFVLLFYRL